MSGAAAGIGEFDVVIVGAGSAGCVLASRLSADPSLRVALIEAGEDTPPECVPPEILDSYPLPLFQGDTWTWPGLEVRATRDAPARRYEQARVVGGGSSINVQAANRGLARDYDEWEAMGASGWGWRDVLPFFRRLERDVDFDGPLHGRSGPLPIRRIFPESWPPFCTAFADALHGQGLPRLLDQNAQSGDGVFPAAFSNLYDRRVSAAIAYLDPVTRRRSNLCILARTTVQGLELEGRHARAVLVRGLDGRLLRIAAREIILSAGALQSPALLMRAGIGPGEHLRELGIPVVHELRGVGANLQDHPALTFCQYLEPRWRLPARMRRASMTAARLSSGLPECEEQDLYLSSAGRASWHALGSRLGLFFLWCNRPYSRGNLHLESPDPRRHPRVELNLLDDPRDAARLVAGVRFLERALRGSPLQAGPGELFPAVLSPRVRALSRLGRRNRILTAAVAGMLDMQPRGARRALLRRMFAGERALDVLVDDEAGLLRMVRRNVFGVWHPSGTCRMGAASDQRAVTDPQGRVHGMKGLRVVDASLMPRLPTANTNLPTIMIAEKIAHEMLGRRTGGAPDPWEATDEQSQDLSVQA